jgi:hypothetical protein
MPGTHNGFVLTGSDFMPYFKVRRPTAQTARPLYNKYNINYQ